MAKPYRDATSFALGKSGIGGPNHGATAQSGGAFGGEFLGPREGQLPLDIIGNESRRLARATSWESSDAPRGQGPGEAITLRTIAREAVAMAAFGESCRDSGHVLCALFVMGFGCRPPEPLHAPGPASEAAKERNRGKWGTRASGARYGELVGSERATEGRCDGQ